MYVIKSSVCACAAMWFCLVSIAAELGDVLWEFPTGGAVVSSPVLDSLGNSYFGSLDGFVYSLDSEGNQRWRYQTTDWVESSPALSLDESRMYIGTWDDRILSINTEDGSLFWDFAVPSLVYASAAIGSDGTIYVGASDGVLYALNPNGTLDWTFEVGGELDSSPAIDDEGNIYVGSSAGTVVSLNSSGEEIWTWEVPSEQGAAGRDMDINSSPMVTSTGTVLVGSMNFWVYGLNAQDGSLAWKYETGGIVEGSFVEGMGRSCLIAGRDGYLYAFSWDGELKWRTFIGANYYSTPCVDGMGRIYAGALKGGTEGVLTVLSSEGEVLKVAEFSGFLDSSPVLSPGGRLLVGSNDGKLYALEGGDKLASLGWARFRGGARGQGSLQGYEDLTAATSEVRVTNYQFDGAESVIAEYRVEGGGPVQVQISGLGSELSPSESVSGYGFSLVGASGEMAAAQAGQAVGASSDGSIVGWLEPGDYTIELSNESEDRRALFLEIKPL